jgi:N6-adenosine-specific RNA methylase IME4
MNALPALPDKFRQYALTLPEQTEQALAHVNDMESAVELLGRNDAIGRYAKRIRMDTETTNAIMDAKFLIIAKLGALLPVEPFKTSGARGGRGKKGGKAPLPPFSKPTRSTFRKFKTHYFALRSSYDLSVQRGDGLPPEEKSTAGFLRYVARQEQERMRQDPADLGKPTYTPDLPTSTYRCLVADPPWPMTKLEREVRPKQGPRLRYKTMTVEAIERLPVQQLIDPKSCHLYLWTTHRFLPDALRIMATWGFTYHCLLTWVKPVGFTPFSWMFNTEHVLFGYAGKLAARKKGLKVSFEAPVAKGSHSEKPDIFFDRVRQFSLGRRLEMFTWKTREGFDAWGNEAI